MHFLWIGHGLKWEIWLEVCLLLFRQKKRRGNKIPIYKDFFLLRLTTFKYHSNLYFLFYRASLLGIKNIYLFVPHGVTFLSITKGWMTWSSQQLSVGQKSQMDQWKRIFQTQKAKLLPGSMLLPHDFILSNGLLIPKSFEFISLIYIQIYIPSYI